MNGFLDAAPPSLVQLLWATDPESQFAILAVLVLAALSVLLVYGPLCLRLARIAKLQRTVTAAFGEQSPLKIKQRDIALAFERSPLAFQWHEFLQRWKSARAADPESSSVDGAETRAPVRLAEILDAHPALPTGARRSLLPALPGLFLAAGVLGTFVGLTLAIPEAAPSLGRNTQFASLVQHVGLALRSALWGLALSIAASLAARWIEGRFEARTEALDLWVRAAYGSITPGELAMRAAHAQRVGFDRLRSELIQVTRDLTDNLDTGLRRIEQSTAKAASLVSDEQRSALGKVVDELVETLKRGVEQHLDALQHSLQTAVEHQGTVTGGLTHAFERMLANSEANERVTQSLVQAAGSVKEAADAINATATEFRPVLAELRQTGGTLERTASRIQSTQENSARTADAVATSVEHSRRALGAQHQLLEDSLGEIRAVFELLSRGLGENLSRALRGIDDALEQTVGRLRETILDSNETIDRLTLPIRAAEGAALETRAILEQARSDIVKLNDWLIQTARPVRSTLNQLGDKTTSLTRALEEFGNRARAVEHGTGERAAVEEDADEEELQLGGEGEAAARHPSADIGTSESQTQGDSEEKPARGQDSNAGSASDSSYRMDTPDCLAAATTLSPAPPAAPEDGPSPAALAGDTECDPESAAAVSLSALLSRPRSVPPETQVARPDGERAAPPAKAPAAAAPSGSATTRSEDSPQSRNPEDEQNDPSQPLGAFRRLFGKKTS